MEDIMKSVMLSIKPKYCELIANGKKTIEVRKTRPKIETPFKCYVYCTKEYYRKGNGYFQGKYCGKVIGEFVCNEIKTKTLSSLIVKEDAESTLKGSCLSKNDIYKYLGVKKWKSIYEQKNNTFYLWHISDLVMYDKPKDLSQFIYICPEFEKSSFTAKCRKCKHYFQNDIDMVFECDCEGEKRLIHPPQSWCYCVGE